ncbi:DUF952 domain-containing protein, partial [Acinetobacter baumannii]|uniref:DUF952 domain-containing protein n=1 Tax=Acinetobacter baumannii TaxID=470 RepID=UPI001AEC8346
IYSPDELVKDGFIHFSFKNQLLDVANAVYKECEKLVILEIETEKLSCPKALKIEDLSNYGVEYPHLYHTLNTSAIVSQFTILNSNSGFKFC